VTTMESGVAAEHKEPGTSVKNPAFDLTDPQQLELLRIAAKQYEDFAPTAEKLVRVRVGQNWRFLRVHVLAVGGIGLFLRVGVTPTRADVLGLGGIGLMVLLVVNVAWAWTIVSITRQAGRKYTVIKDMERSLPFHPHTAEWELAGRGKFKSFLPRWVVELGMPVMTTLVWLGAYLVVWLVFRALPLG